jgi:outer membrane beta-barrel protein
MRCIQSHQQILLKACLVGALFFCLSAQSADPIEFPDEELATESVLPVFDQMESVKSRTIVKSRRVEIGAIAGYSLTQPFYNPLNFGLTGSYHFSEDHGINFFGTYFLQGLSNYGSQLNPIPNTNPPINANLQYAPAPQYLALTSWQWTGYYGKLSLAKNFVINLSLYSLLGAGVMGVGDVTRPAISVGFGQKFFFNPRLALRFDLRLVAYHGPDVLSRALDGQNSVQPASSFDEKLQYSSLLSFGAVFLLPEM